MIDLEKKPLRLFCSFASADFYKKPDVPVANRPSEGLFTDSCDKGIVWSIPVNDDIAEVRSKMFFTGVNYAGVLIVFTSDDYHKIDKLSWEKYVSNSVDDISSHVYDYIDDSIDDKHAEFIVSYGSMRISAVCFIPAILEPSLNVKAFLNVGFDTLIGDDLFLRSVNTLHQDFMTFVKTFGIHLNMGREHSSQEDIVQSNGELALWFNLFFSMIIVGPFVNANREFSYHLPQIGCYPVDWGRYMLKYGHRFLALKNKISCFFNDGCVGGVDVYDKLYAEVYDLFDFSNEDVFLARVNGYNRNDPCPCGSGKKWKKCHGIDF